MLIHWLILGWIAASHAAPPPVENIADAPAAIREVPGPESFQLGPGDRLTIRVWPHDDLTMDVTIGPDGTFTYPLIGRVAAAGLTYPALVDQLTAALSEYYNGPQITVNLVELQSQKVFVLGEVTTPSVLNLTSEMTVLEALTVAGGINQYAATKNVLLIRGGLDEPALYTIDVRAIMNEGRLDQLVNLRPGDILVVPTRTITNAARFFRDVQSVLAPLVAASAIYRNALGGGAQGTSSVLE